MDIRELLLHIRAGSSDRQTHQDTGIDRRTVKRYKAWATEQGLLDGPLPALEELQVLAQQTLPEQTPRPSSPTAPWSSNCSRRTSGSPRSRPGWPSRDSTALTRRCIVLCARSSQALPRRRCASNANRAKKARLISAMPDAESGQLRRTWAFVMTLSWSRHQYVEFVFDQKVGTWLRCHRNALTFFGGVPRRIVVDNLKAAGGKAIWDDPQVQQSYRQCAEHYGFVIAPCRPRTPEHKGKVEQGGVHYVKRNFLGGRQPTTITQANQDVRAWCNHAAGQRIHGTTREKPLLRFQDTEQAVLQPLPDSPYDMAVWKQVKLHHDCYINFDYAYYSAPHRLIGQTLWVSGGLQFVHLYTADYQLVATHDRAQRPGQRQTHLDHLPPDKVAGLILSREGGLTAAAEVGEATLKVAQSLLDDPVVERIYTVGRLLKLRQKFGDERLEAACQRALRFDDPNYKTVKRILVQRLDQQPLPDVVTAPEATLFARTAQELVGDLAGGERWN